MVNCKVTHYKAPSKLGLPILKILIDNPHGECRFAIYKFEREFGWGFNLCSAVKYLWRLGEKSPNLIGDLDKAIDYLNWELDEPISSSQEHFRIVQQAIVACEELRTQCSPTIRLEHQE